MRRIFFTWICLNPYWWFRCLDSISFPAKNKGKVCSFSKCFLTCLHCNFNVRKNKCEKNSPIISKDMCICGRMCDYRKGKNKHQFKFFSLSQTTYFNVVCLLKTVQWMNLNEQLSFKLKLIKYIFWFIHQNGWLQSQFHGFIQNSMSGPKCFYSYVSTVLPHFQARFCHRQGLRMVGIQCFHPMPPSNTAHQVRQMAARGRSDTPLTS